MKVYVVFFGDNYDHRIEKVFLIEENAKKYIENKKYYFIEECGIEDVEL